MNAPYPRGAGVPGGCRPTVSNYIRLLGLPANIQQSVAAGHLSFGHARVLAGLQEPKNQKALFRRILDKGLNVRQTEREASEIVGRKPTKKSNAAALSLQMQTMRAHLRTRFSGRSLDMKVGAMVLDALNCTSRTRRICAASRRAGAQ